MNHFWTCKAETKTTPHCGIANVLLHPYQRLLLSWYHIHSSRLLLVRIDSSYCGRLFLIVKRRWPKFVKGGANYPAVIDCASELSGLAPSNVVSCAPFYRNCAESAVPWTIYGSGRCQAGSFAVFVPIPSDQKRHLLPLELASIFLSSIESKKLLFMSSMHSASKQDHPPETLRRQRRKNNWKLKSSQAIVYSPNDRVLSTERLDALDSKTTIPSSRLN